VSDSTVLACLVSELYILCCYSGDHTALAKEMRGCSPVLARLWRLPPGSAFGVIGNGEDNSERRCNISVRKSEYLAGVVGRWEKSGSHGMRRSGIAIHLLWMTFLKCAGNCK
jgi:hypothetical protein